MEKSCYEKKFLSTLCDCQNVCVIPKAYNRQKKIYWGWKREEDRVEGKRVKKFMKKFLYLEFQIPSFFRITIASMWRRERRRKFNLLIATLECVSSKPKIESRKIRNIFLFYFVVSDLCACFGST